MSQEYNIIWADTAEKDLKNIIEYIADDSPLNAQKVFKKSKRRHQAYIPSLTVADCFLN